MNNIIVKVTNPFLQCAHCGKSFLIFHSTTKLPMSHIPFHYKTANIFFRQFGKWICFILIPAFLNPLIAMLDLNCKWSHAKVIHCTCQMFSTKRVILISTSSGFVPLLNLSRHICIDIKPPKGFDQMVNSLVGA